MDLAIKPSTQALEEFKRIYQEEYGEILSDSDAKEIATSLLRLFWILCHPSAAQGQNSLVESSTASH